jgi:hypothetical protein
VCVWGFPSLSSCEKREERNPRSGAASIDRSNQTALQGTAPQPNKSRLQADSERLYIARDGSGTGVTDCGKSARSPPALKTESPKSLWVYWSRRLRVGDGTPIRPGKARDAQICLRFV